MTQSEAITVVRDMLMVTAKIAAPILLLSMGVGLLISIIQAATQIHEQTITFVPKLALIILVLLAGGSWMLNTIMDFTNELFVMMIG